MNEKSGDRAQARLRNNTLVFVDAQMDPCSRGLIDICDCAYFVFVIVICICICSNNLSDASTGSVITYRYLWPHKWIRTRAV